MLIQTPSLKDLRTLKFNDIHLLQLSQFMYSCKNSFLLQGLITISPKAINSTQYKRNSQAYRLPYCRTNTKTF